MKIAICDDDKFCLKELEQQIDMLSIEIKEKKSFSTLETFMLTIDDGKHYDAVLMDIHWGDNKTGVDIAAELYKKSPETKIIFVTGYNDCYSQQIFLHPTNLSGYLTKPVNSEILKFHLSKVLNETDSTKPTTLSSNKLENSRI